ncbi:MAG TPA: ester cyclase, partial [Chthoniobacterales bacterium]
GEMAFICDGVWHHGGPGTYAFGPRGLAHGFKVIGNSPARMLLLCSPGGFESFVIELGAPLSDPVGPPDMAKLIATAAKYGVDIHGPLPEEPAESANHAVLPHTAADLKALIARWIQAFNDRDWKTEREVRSDSFQANLSGTPFPLDNDAWTGFMTEFTNAFPDAHITIESMVAEGDAVIARWSLSGTHRGAFKGVPATGNSIRFKGIEWNLVSRGKLIEHNAQFDLAALLQQIGAMPS